MTDHEAKAREIARANFSDQINSAFHPDETQERLVSAIASALREAEAGERERCAKIVMEHSDRFLRQFHEADTISLELGRIVTEVRSWAAAIRSRNDE